MTPHLAAGRWNRRERLEHFPCKARPKSRLWWRVRCAIIGPLAAGILLFAGCAKIRRADYAQIREAAVRFKSDGATLAGTLILPARKPPFPGVLLFHGSGPQDRDLFTAHWFAEQGVAALAYDKRGVGESTGDFRSVAFMELADDGLAAIQVLKSRADIRREEIGVWGLSQGGWLGPLAASRSHDIAFVIAVSGPAVSPGEQMIFFYAEELRANGMEERDVAAASAARRVIWNYLSTGQGYVAAQKAMADARTKRWYDQVKAQQDNLFEPLSTPEQINDPGYRYARWFKKEAVYDPVPALRALKVPVLFLFGDHDRLVQVPETVAILQRLMSEDHALDFTIRVIQGADHGMRLVTSDARGSVSSEYLEDMRVWLKAHVEKAH